MTWTIIFLRPIVPGVPCNDITECVVESIIFHGEHSCENTLLLFSEKFKIPCLNILAAVPGEHKDVVIPPETILFKP